MMVFVMTWLSIESMCQDTLSVDDYLMVTYFLRFDRLSHEASTLAVAVFP